MSINFCVLSIVSQVNELWKGNIKTEPTKNIETNTSALIFVILEICIKDLIKYLPNLLQSGKKRVEPDTNRIKFNSSKSSFLYIHVTKCSKLAETDVELLKKIIDVLNDLPFHSGFNFDSKFIFVKIFQINL